MKLPLLLSLSLCCCANAGLETLAERPSPRASSARQPPALAPATPEVAAPPPPAPPPADPPKPDPKLRVVVADLVGNLCILDPDSGALRAKQPGASVDLLASRSRRGVVASLEPAAGALVRYRLDGDALLPIGLLPFDAPDGRLLDEGEATVGVAVSEAHTLFRAVDGEGPGMAWSPVRSAAALPAAHQLTLLTAAPPEAPLAALRQATLDAAGLHPGPWSEVAAGQGIALFAAHGGVGAASALGGALAVRWPDGMSYGYSLQVDASTEVHEALWMGDDRGLAVLVGPAPAVLLLGPEGPRRVGLGEGPAAAPSLPSHQLALDRGRGRLWALARGRLVAIDLTAGAPAAEGACGGAAVALVGG